MTTQTLRPNSTESASAWSRTGGTTKHGVLADDSDATYLYNSGAAAAGIFGLETYTLASGERVKRVRGRIRYAGQSASDSPRAQLRLRDGAGVQKWSSTGPSRTGTSPYTYTGPWVDAATVLTSAASQQSEVDALEAMFEDVDSGIIGEEMRCHEVWVDLDVWARTDAPTVSIVEESAGTVTDTDTPTVEFYTAALNDGSPSQYTRQVRVFRDAVYGAGGFDPATETDVEWEQADTVGLVSTTSGSPDSISVGEPLANSDTYRAYVRYGKNDVAGQTLWSEWSYAEFTLSLTLPDPPEQFEITVEQPDGRQYVRIVTAVRTHDTIERVEVQRRDDSGTWTTIRGGVRTEDDDGTAYTGLDLIELYDYDAPRDTVLEYRARTTEGIAASGTTITSDWTTAASVVHPNDESWWLYDVDQWTEIASGVRVVGYPDDEIVSDVGVFYPLGRSGEAVVVTGTSHGDDGSYTIKATGADECAAIDALARWDRRVLVKTPFGDQKYVVWTSRRRTRAGVPSQPRHTWELDYAEVDDGIGSDG